MKNSLKRKLILLSMLSLVLVTIVGCTSNYNKNYTIKEKELINFANSEISKIYSVNINKEELDYSIAKQVDENKFEKLQENDNPEIVVISAYKVDKPKKGEVLNYVFIYNTQKKAIISSDIEIM